jgi:hypothetical protein
MLTRLISLGVVPDHKPVPGWSCQEEIGASVSAEAHCGIPGRPSSQPAFRDLGNIDVEVERMCNSASN